MKRYLLLTFSGMMVICPHGLFAGARIECNGGITYSTCAESNPDNPTSCNVVNAAEMVIYDAAQKCAAISTVWYKGRGIMNCDRCIDGAVKVNVNFTLDTGCQAYYDYCKCQRTTTCSAGTWYSAGAGYEQRTNQYDLCGTCKTKTEYRCAAGYWGSPSSATSGCTACDKLGGHGTSAAGSTSRTKCYVPAGAAITDNIGTYKFSNNCYYSN